MNITSAKYIDAENTGVNQSIKAIIGGQTMFVSLDPANRHYIAIQEWVAEGNTIAEAD